MGSLVYKIQLGSFACFGSIGSGAAGEGHMQTGLLPMGCIACKLLSSAHISRLRPEASLEQAVLLSVQRPIEQLLCNTSCQLRGAMQAVQEASC